MWTWLADAAARRPAHPAVGALTYSELAKRARAAAGALAVEPGTRLGIALPPSPDFAVALHATLWLGATAVPLDLRLPEEERAHRADGCQLVIDEPLDATGDGDGPDPVPLNTTDVVTVIHTSGTTSAARPVELTAGNWHANALGSQAVIGHEPGERWLLCLPLAHVGGLSILFRSVIHATTVVLHERFDPEQVAETLAKGDATLVSLVPTQLSRVLDAGLQSPPNLRTVLLGGGPIPPPLLRRAAEAGVPVTGTYGMTEACSQIATGGKVLPGTELEIAPDGEILVRGRTVAPRAIGPDGWLHTGDLGQIDEQGRLQITGRKADTIVTGGENVAPVPVEAVLLEHPDVLDAAVHGRPDPEWGERVVATVVLRPGAPSDPDALRAHAAARLAGFQVPKEYRFTEALPRNATGKLLRGEL